MENDESEDAGLDEGSAEEQDDQDAGDEEQNDEEIAPEVQVNGGDDLVIGDDGANDENASGPKSSP